MSDIGVGCACAVTHTPSAYIAHTHYIIPLSWNGEDTEENRITLCPNTHSAVHHLIDEYVNAGGDPGWEVRRHYGSYARRLAARAWVNRPENPSELGLPA